MYSEIEMTNKVKRNLCEIDLVAFFPSHLLCATISKEFYCYCATHMNHICVFYFVWNAFCIFHLIGFVLRASPLISFSRRLLSFIERLLSHFGEPKNVIMKFDSMRMQINDRAPQNEGKATATTTRATRTTQATWTSSGTTAQRHSICHACNTP